MAAIRLFEDERLLQRALQTASHTRLVLTGEATAEQAMAFDPRPDLIVRDLSELGELLRGGQ